MENDPTLNYNYTIGAIALTLMLYAAIMFLSYAHDRYKGIKLPWHGIIHEPLKKSWALFVLGIWMLLLILGFVYQGSSDDRSSKTQPITFSRANPPIDVIASVEGDQTFAKGRSTLLRIRVRPARHGDYSGVTSTVRVVQDGAFKLTPVAQSDHLSLNSGLRWDYIATPTADGHSMIVVLVCGYNAQRLNIGCEDWDIPIYVRQWLVPPGLINIGNWSALVGLLASMVALLGAASQLRKKPVQVPVSAMPKQDAVMPPVSDSPAKVG